MQREQRAAAYYQVISVSRGLRRRHSGTDSCFPEGSERSISEAHDIPDGKDKHNKPVERRKVSLAI